MRGRSSIGPAPSSLSAGGGEAGGLSSAEEGRERLWRCRDRSLALGRRTLLMGVLNVTPDSFSDGGQFWETERAVERAWQIAEEGADLLDIGGMSSRPGSEEIPPEEERARVLPVLERLGEAYPLPVSIDTYREAVARAALERGAVIVNDITALRGDPQLLPLVTETGAGLVLMHMRGTPRTMQEDTHYDNLRGEIGGFLERQLSLAEAAGVPAERVVLDPGIGFGKSVAGNLELIRSAGAFRSRSAGVLVGPSRKSFIGKLLDRPADGRAWGTAAALALAIAAGADIVRVHDVAAMVEVCRIADALVRES